jgi:hypothetical protein
LSKQLDLRIWPNPANGSVHVELPFNSAHVFTLELTDAAGRTVLADCKPTTPKSVLLNAGMLTPGVWSIRVTDGSHMAVGRFVRMEP